MRKPCHNCRRSRLRCDLSVPACRKCFLSGQQCLGYGKMYTWNNGVASRGKMMGKSFEMPADGSDQALSQPSSFSRPPSTRASSNPDSDTKRPLEAARAFQLGPSLLDPLVQDLSYSLRYYLSHFCSRLCQDLVTYDIPSHNPYRNLVAMTKEHPFLLQVIIANSAIHISNLHSHRPPIHSATNETSFASPGVVVSTKFKRDALLAEQLALQRLRQALPSIDRTGQDVVLTGILLFINFELMSSGKDGWKVHVDGARRIIDDFDFSLVSPSAETTMLHDYVVSDCLIYYVLGSTFSTQALNPKTQQQAMELLPVLERAQVNSYLSCPAELLQIMLWASHLSRSEVIQESQSWATAGHDQSLELMSKARSFDVRAWAARVRGISTHDDFDSRLHVASAHKAAICLYLHRAVPWRNLLQRHEIDQLTADIIQHLSHIQPGNHLLKSTSWPAFIAGAESRDRRQRVWILEHLSALWEMLPWGYLHTEVEMLTSIWSGEKDDSEAGDGQNGWLHQLKSRGKDWIVV